MPNPISDALTLGPHPIVGSGASTQSTSRLDRSIFGRLLWKDWMVVKQVVMAIAIIIPAIQSLFVLLSRIVNENSSGLAGATVSMTVLSPTLIALGCSGMLIGHERQTGTWGWSSSLPTSWLSALTSKLVVTICACVGVFFLTAAIPIILLANGVLPPPPNDFRLVYVSFIMVLVWFEIIVFFNLASLLFREPIVALLVGAIAVSVAQLMVIGTMANLSASFVHSVGLFGSPEETELVLSVGLGFLFFLAAFFGMIWTFRWRWQYGQSVPLTSWTKTLRSTRAEAIDYQIRDNVSPSEFGSQLVLAFKQTFGLRLIIVACVVPTVSWLNRNELRDLAYGLIFQAIGVLGATTFAGDQSLERFKFLADRGASPHKLVTTRVIVAMGFALVILVACTIGMPIDSPRFDLALDNFTALSLLLFAFSIGALGSLCIRRPIIAVTASVVTVGVCGICLLVIHTESRYCWPVASLRDAVFNNLYAASVTGCACVLIAAIYRIASKWCTRDHVNLGIRYVISIPLAIVAVVSAMIHFGFFLQTSYDPKEFPVAAAEVDVSKIPEIKDPDDRTDRTDL